MAETRTLGLAQIGQIAVNVRALERAIAFYRDTLGMQFLFQVPNMAFFDCAGVRLLLSIAEQPEFDHPSSIIYFKVEDLNAAFATLSSRGVAFADKPHLIARMPDYELWMAFFRDSEANMLALMSEVRS